ncbi:MAG: hypothetical protein AAGM33_11725, partial [Pseudomonadota bacterium]
MPLTPIDDIKVGAGASNIVLVIGDQRFTLKPETAAKVSNALGNAALNNFPQDDPIPVVKAFQISPNEKGGSV